MSEPLPAFPRPAGPVGHSPAEGSTGRNVTPLRDGLGRRIDYLRFSLTDRCNFRCSYCSPGAVAQTTEPLTRAEIRRLLAIFARIGIRRLRLTGGEPTLRPDLLEIVADARDTPGIQEIALTTNGHRLSTLARPLRAAGVSRLSVSLDSLDPQRLEAIAGPSASLAQIIRGLEEAAAVGFASLKLNTVVLRGVNQDELGELARFAWRYGAASRFIELMPFGKIGGEPIPTAEVKRLLEAQGVRLSPDGSRGWGPAHYLRGESLDAGSSVSGLVGFIGAMTESFCLECNRIRLDPGGALRTCLGGRTEAPLAPLLRSGDDDEALIAQIVEAVRVKGKQHDMACGGLLPIFRIGG